ncbi:PKD domain-containing protein [Tropicimonas aquimaris]|uniref:PKD domain-containing protein n=1 Tax=Tropicimonas aquimaris TaxID=914152 RepID=A0ABW3IM27_9RHOB
MRRFRFLSMPIRGLRSLTPLILLAGLLIQAGEVQAAPSVTIRAEAPNGIAPHGVFFRAAVEDWGERPAHELRYRWEFGENRAARVALPRVAAIWGTSLGDAFGPTAMHVFATPGSYTVTCEVTDGTTTITATATVVVEDPERAFGPAGTIVVAQDGDFTGAPPGARHTRLDTALHAYARLGVARGRLLLKRGETYALRDAIDIRDDKARKNFYIGAWGQGARPLLDTSANPRPAMHRGPKAMFPVQIWGLEIRGGWDPVTETGRPSPGLLMTQSGQWTVYDMHFTGLSIAVHMSSKEPGSMALSDCVIERWQGYGLLAKQSTFVGITGCRIEQDPMALGGGPKGGRHNDHGPVRFSAPLLSGYHVLDKVQLFSRNGWSTAGGRQAHQALIRWNVTGTRGPRLNAQRIVGEGGWSFVDLHGNTSTAKDRLGEVILEKSLFIGTANTQGGVFVGHSGVSLRNSVFVFPDVPKETNRGPSAVVRWAVDTRFTDAENNAGPIRVYNNTVVDLRSDANSDSPSRMEEASRRDFTDVVVANNVVLTPNVGGGTTADAPLDATPLFEAYYPGLVDTQTWPLDPAFASPEGFIALYRPQSGSAAIGDAGQGPVALDDLTGALRGQSPSRGALEPE